jgi:hypothetical protein
MKNLRKYFKFVSYLFVFAAHQCAAADHTEDFFTSVKRDHRSRMESLLRSGVDPNTTDASGNPGLVFALRIESYEVAAALIESPRLDPDAENPQGETALMLACLRGQQGLAARLVKRGASIRRDGWTPLHYAAASSEGESMVAWLLDRGALIDAEAPNGNTPLMMAARDGTIASAELLLRLGADATRRNSLNQTAADMAEQAGRDDLAERLRRRTRQTL